MYELQGKTDVKTDVMVAERQSLHHRHHCHGCISPGFLSSKDWLLPPRTAQEPYTSTLYIYSRVILVLYTPLLHFVPPLPPAYLNHLEDWTDWERGSSTLRSCLATRTRKCHHTWSTSTSWRNSGRTISAGDTRQVAKKASNFQGHLTLLATSSAS